MPFEPGTTLGPYHVTAKIGAGGMGEVWQARDTKLDRDVALEVLRQPRHTGSNYARPPRVNVRLSSVMEGRAVIR